MTQKLAREVRFCVNPFLAEDQAGYNSYAARPAGEGLAMFFSLVAEVTGEIDPQTGFVVNIVEIDSGIREAVVPVFSQRIRTAYAEARHIDYTELAELLRDGAEKLTGRFGGAELGRLTLNLTPFRKLSYHLREPEMVYFSEKFEFAATHTLWSDKYSAEQNAEVFGKCANPAGHGHNYVVEVTVSTPAGRHTLNTGQFERVVDQELIEPLDHKNLNTEIAEFEKTNPTVENIAVFCWGRLVGKFQHGNLHCVTVWETDKTWCSYHGE